MPTPPVVALRRFLEALPRGRVLPGDVWERRHRMVTIVVWLHVPALIAFALVTGRTPGHALLDAVPVALFAAGAGCRQLQRGPRSAMATLGAFMASAILVHLADGMTEAHFHFFVMVGLVTLYQDWLPFLVGIAFTVGEHGILGVLAPSEVYAHAPGQRSPWAWAAIHGGFVLAASVVHVAAWRSNERTALWDPLTDLPNRTLLHDRLHQSLRRHRDGGPPVTVLALDLDGFKAVNDQRGHAAGDELLVEVGRRLEGAIRAGDAVGRMGGDEFAIVLDRADADAGAAVAAQVLAAFEAPFAVAGAQVRIGASIGCASAAPGDVRAEDLLHDADLAMYVAKGAGRGRAVAFEPRMRDGARADAALEADLPGAIDRGELVLHYQPAVALDGEGIDGVEALVRWHHPRLGLLAPDAFVHIAERTDAICDLGRWVLDAGCRQVAAWQVELDRPDLQLAVNLSARHLTEPGLVDDVLGAAARAGLHPSTLVVEITESALVHDLDGCAGALAELRQAGVRVAVDDFGTGYSSLSYLRDLPVDVLKIDRSFVRRLGEDEASTSLAQAIVEIGRALALEVIAEGVERRDQADALRGFRCDHAQGYLYGRPLPAADAAEVLRRSAAEAFVPVA